MSEKALLIDGLNLLFRAFYSLPPNMRSPSGEPTNALFGFVRTLDSLNKKYSPKTIIVALDSSVPTWRKKEYPKYKAGRPETPENLLKQIKFFRTFLNQLGINCIESPGYEADDVLASLSKKLLEKKIDPIVVSNDKDLLQTLEKGVSILRSGRSISQIKLITKKTLTEEYGFNPEFIPDFKGLVGDSSDNLKGVKGIGEKTAKTLLQKYKNLDEIYENLEELPESQKNKLQNDKESAYFCKKLATLNSDLKININNISKMDLTNKSAQEILFQLGMTTFVIDRAIKTQQIGKSFRLDRNKTESKEMKIKNLDAEAIKKELEKSKTVFLLPYEKSWICYTKESLFRPEENEGLFTTEINIKNYLTKNHEIIGFDLANKKININHSDFINAFDLKSYAFFIDSENPSMKNLWEKTFNEKMPENPSFYLPEFKKLKQNIEKNEKIKNYYEKVEKPFLLIIEKMNRTGVPINLEEAENLEKRFNLECLGLEKKIKDISNSQKLNPRSPKQLGELLFDKLKLPEIKKRSTARSVLDKLLGKHPIIELLIKYREKHKLLTSYMVPFIKYRKDNGRIYPTFDPYGTKSGRLASRDPNFQVLPIKTEDGKKVRKCVQAEKNFSIVSIDYSQIDLRVLAHLSKDKMLLNIFNNNEDVHSQTASLMLKKSKEKISEEDRRIAKIINFGIIYGMGPSALSKQIGSSLEKSKNEIKKYFEKFSGVSRWIKETKIKGNQELYTETLDGRRRYVNFLGTEDWKRQEAERQAINNCVQGGSSDVIKRAMVKISNSLNKDFELILQVHDELVFHVNDNILEESINKAKKAMEKALELRIPLRVSIKIGKKYEF